MSAKGGGGNVHPRTPLQLSPWVKLKPTILNGRRRHSLLMFIIRLNISINYILLLFLIFNSSFKDYFGCIYKTIHNKHRHWWLLNDYLNCVSYLGAAYEPVGCFHDSGVVPRPLPELLGNFRSNIDWQQVELTVDKCAQLAKVKGYFFY